MFFFFFFWFIYQMTIVWLTFMVISQMSQASICAMAKKVEDKT